MLTEDCRRFIDAFVGTATGKRYNSKAILLDDIKKISNFKNGGIFFDSTIGKYGAGGNQTGHIENGTTTVRISGMPTELQEQLPYNIHGFAGTILNEFIHGISGAGDKEGSRIIAEMGIIPVTSSGKPLTYPLEDKDYAFSGYFHTAIGNFCH